MKGKLSTTARIWISLCMAACVILIVFLFIQLLSGDSPLSGVDLSTDQLIVSLVACYLFLAGYIVLMCGKKAGFWIVLAVAVLLAVYDLSRKLVLPAVLSLVNPAITWLFLRGRWSRWKQIDEHRSAVQRQTKKVKSRKTALILSALPWTGLLGVDRFYLGYVGMGILKFLTAGGCLVLYILDIVKIAKGTMPDRYGRPLI